MRIDKKMTPVERWKVLGGFLRRGDKYKFTCTDNDSYEATFNSIFGSEDDVDVHVLNVRDLSERPRFDGRDSLLIGVSELVAVEPA